MSEQNEQTKEECTPGPWAAHLAYNRWRIYEPHGPMVEDALGNRVPKAIAFALRAGGREEANARLIAAAPEMREACQRVIDEFEQYITRQGQTAIQEPVAVDMARQALAKAEGTRHE